MQTMIIVSSFMGMNRIYKNIIILLLIIIIAYLDYLTPYEMSLRFFYLFPLFLVAWDKKGLVTSLVFSLLSSLSYFFTDYLLGNLRFNSLFIIWEFFVNWAFFTVIAIFIYKIKQYSGQIEEKNIILKHANNVKHELIRIASHDLRNPLFNIMSLSSIIRDSENVTRDQVLQYNDWIYESCERMNYIIKEYLNAHKSEQTQITVAIKNVALNKLMERLVRFYNYKASTKKINIHLSVPEDNMVILADEMHAYQVLDNILSNAIKYSPVGKNVWIEILNDSNSSKNKDRVLVKIKDEGPGFTREDLSKLYSKDTKLSAMPTGGESSTGNGLYIAKKLCEEMNSEIWCEQNDGTGAAFFVAFNKPG